MTDVPQSRLHAFKVAGQAMGNLGWRRIGLAHANRADHLVGHSARSIRLSALKSPVFCPPSDRPTLSNTTLLDFYSGPRCLGVNCWITTSARILYSATYLTMASGLRILVPVKSVIDYAVSFCSLLELRLRRRLVHSEVFELLLLGCSPRGSTLAFSFV